MMSASYKIMGVINVTPDSFSDGGKYYQTENALKQALELIQQGADIIDIGGESTRPGAEIIDTDEEIKRVVPIIKALRAQDSKITISIDTTKPQVMRAAIKAGANFINDTNALQAEGALELVAEANIPVCLMHKQGQSKSMQNNPKYAQVLVEVMEFLGDRADVCMQAGVKEENIIIDPGIGFGKTLEHNLTLLRHIEQLNLLDFPVLIGVSRKSMVGEILNREVEDRLYGSLAIAQYCYLQGAEYLRVHDVRATKDILDMTEILYYK